MFVERTEAKKYNTINNARQRSAPKMVNTELQILVLLYAGSHNPQAQLNERHWEQLDGQHC